MAEEKSTGHQIPPSMWCRALLVATQSFLFGYTFSCLNACLVVGDDNDGSECFHGEDSSCPKGTIYNDINLSTIEAQAATSLCVLGAWIGSLIGNIPCEFYGRRNTVLGNNSLFIVGGILSALGNIHTLFAGRFVTGIGVGIASIVSPVLLSEIATTETRGTITTLCQVMVTFAIFFAALLGYGLVTYVDHGWQWIQAFGAVPASMTICLYQYVPESPKWLLSFGNKTKESDNAASSDTGRQSDKANLMTTYGSSDTRSSEKTSCANEWRLSKGSCREQVYLLLQDLRVPDHDINREIQEMENEVAKESNSNDAVTWADVFQYKEGVIIGCGLMFFQAFSGINSVIFYSTTIFGLAGFNEAIIGSCAVGIINFGMTIVSNKLIDTMGRKVLLNTGVIVMTVSLVVLSSVLLLPIDEHVQGWLAVLAILVYISGFAISLGCVPWVVMSEVMPTRVRSKAMSLFLSINWFANLIIGALTLTAIDLLGGAEDSMDDDTKSTAEKKGVSYLYMIFACICVLTLVFMSVYVPETKGRKNAEESKMKPLISKDNYED